VYGLNQLFQPEVYRMVWSEPWSGSSQTSL